MWLSNEMCCRPSQNTTFLFKQDVLSALARLERCQEPGLTSHVFTCLHVANDEILHCFWISRILSRILSSGLHSQLENRAILGIETAVMWDTPLASSLWFTIAMPSQISRPCQPDLLRTTKRACQFSIQPSYIIIYRWTLTDLTPPFCWPNIWSHLP